MNVDLVKSNLVSGSNGAYNKGMSKLYLIDERWEVVVVVAVLVVLLLVLLLLLVLWGGGEEDMISEIERNKRHVLVQR